MFICGGGTNYGYRLTKPSYVCSFCTDKGIPGGYIDREEWALDRLAKGWEQNECPQCKRFNFKDEFKKPHGSCSVDLNKVRSMLIKNTFAPQHTEKP